MPLDQYLDTIQDGDWLLTEEGSFQSEAGR